MAGQTEAKLIPAASAAEVILAEIGEAQTARGELPRSAPGAWRSTGASRGA